MNFFGIGGGEVILVLIVALIIWGPKRLPEIARTLGKTVNMLKKSTYDLTSQITRELDTENTKDKEKDVPSPPEANRNVKPKKS
ncbi:MAG: twin-arginine translocase subunit TatB [Chloroflexi bacterium]|nr:twin-arginine translocase subunit TatB [Chloroflexota bacterium]